MSIVMVGSTSGSITLQEPAIAGSTVLDLPATSGTILTTGSSGQVIPKAALPTGSVLQVVSTVKTDTFTSAVGTTWTDITGMSVSIAPTSSTSRILVFSTIQGALFRPTANGVIFRLMRDSTAIGLGDAAGSRERTTFGAAIASVDSIASATINFLDTPATTSATTYKIQFWQDTPASPLYINRTANDANVGSNQRCISTITVMEIAA